MKKTAIVLIALIFVGISITSCQKAKEDEGKKEAQTQKQETQAQKEEGKTQPVEIKPQQLSPLQIEAKKQPSEAKSETQPKKEQSSIPHEVKKEQKPTAAFPKAEPGPLTEEEQKYIIKWDWMGPRDISVKAALKGLKILLKAEPYQMRRYVEWEEIEEYGGTTSYEGDICVLAEILGASGKSEAFNMLTEVLEKRKGDSEALACTLRYIRRFENKSIIPILKEYITYQYPWPEEKKKEWMKRAEPKVRLQAAGSLLALGEADDALPVLDELAKQGQVEALAKLFKTDKEGVVRWSTLKFWDERGLEIMKRAIDYPSDEVKGWAAIALVSLSVEKEKVEEVALNIVKKLMYKTEKEYGIGRKEIPGKTYTEEFLLPGYEGQDLWELRSKLSSDTWACWRAISALGRLKSKRAVPLLKYIKDNNTDSDNVCWENRADRTAEWALEKILENGGANEDIQNN